MKTSVRFFAVLVAVLMIATAAISVSAFSDVQEGHDHATAIGTLTQLGVINGYADGTFKPENNVERDEMAKLVYVLYTTFKDAGKGTAKFSDLAADNWAAGYVTWCSAKSIVGGYEDGTFRPDNNVTYDEALKMVCATLGYTDFDSALWPTDVRMKALNELDLGKDIEANGSDYLTRAQVAQLLYNALSVSMNEYKLDKKYNKYWVEDGTNPDGTTKYKEDYVEVPVEVAKTLRTDVWNFKTETLTVVATEKLAVTGSTATGEKDEIVLSDSNSNVALKDLLLTDLEGKTDALIGLKVQRVTRTLNGKTINLGTTVLGSTKVVKLEASFDKSGDAENDAVIIDGVLYGQDKNSDTKFGTLKTYAISGDVLTTTAHSAANIVNVTTVGDRDVADLEYPHMAIAMDYEGDGIVDALNIQYFKYAKVYDSANLTDTTTKEKYTQFYASNDPAAKDQNETIRYIADGKTIKEGDFIVYAKVNDTYYIDAVVAPVKTGVDQIVGGENATIKFDGEAGEAKFVHNGQYLYRFGDMIDLVAKAKDLIAKDAEEQEYFIYNGYVVYYTAPTTTAESYDLALLLYTEGKSTSVYNNETKQMEYSYPALLLIDGKEVKVNLSTIDGKLPTDAANTKYILGYDGGTPTDPSDDNLESDGKTPKMEYALVNYVVDKKTGTYALKTTAAKLGDTEVFTAGTIKYNATAKLHTFTYNDGTQDKTIQFVLDDASAIYYTYNNKEDSTDLYKYYGFYNKTNLTANMEDTAIAQPIYLVKAPNAKVYTLLATLVADVIDAKDAGTTKIWENDARLIKYATADAIAQKQDGNGYYAYSFLDFATLTNGSAVVDTTELVEDATVTTKGVFYGWNKVGDIESYEIVKAAASNGSVKLGTIANVIADLNYVAIDGVAYTNADFEGKLDAANAVNFAEGISITADTLIFGAKDDKIVEYVKYDINTLAELADSFADNGKTLDVAVGTYLDDEGKVAIAWIIVDTLYENADKDIVENSKLVDQFR